MWKKQPPKILLVEDNVTNRRLFQEVFTAAGFVVEVTDAAGAGLLHTVKKFTPDIISMDIMMAPNQEVGDTWDGFAAITTLQADGETKEIPIVVLTSFFEEGKVLQAKSLGVVDFINLQSQNIQALPQIFLNYLNSPKKYIPVHPLMQA